MPTSTFTYNLDGAMTAASGEPFSTIRRHNYTRLPVEITGGSSIALRYDSYGRRLRKTGAQTIFYRSGMHHPAADRTKEIGKGNGLLHTLVELVDGAATIYLFTPAGQNVTRRADGYARVARDHLRSVRVELSSAAQISAHYSAYGEALFYGGGGGLRRAFAGYEPDAETGLYNANRRLYAPTLRLFISVDPRLQSASPYPYCAADPFNFTDPTGGLSSSIISAIVAVLVTIVAVAVTIGTGGAAGPFTIPEMVAADSQATEVGVVSATAVAYAKFGATIGVTSSVITNGADLTIKAAHGEHITAWQAVKSMLIEPVIAGVAGGIGGGIGGAGLTAATNTAEDAAVSTAGRYMAFGLTTLGGSAAGGIASTSYAALDGQIQSRRSLVSIGVTMAIAIGEAMVFMVSHFNNEGIALWESADSSSAEAPETTSTTATSSAKETKPLLPEAVADTGANAANGPPQVSPPKTGPQVGSRVASRPGTPPPVKEPPHQSTSSSPAPPPEQVVVFGAPNTGAPPDALVGGPSSSGYSPPPQPASVEAAAAPPAPGSSGSSYSSNP